MISIIVPVKNEGINILNTVQSLLQSPTTMPYEIIVVDHKSTDGCCDSLASYVADGRIILTTTSDEYLAIPKNVGARLAKGEILIFCDAHVSVPDNWIERLIDPIVKKQADATAPAIAVMDKPNNVGCGQTWDKNLCVKWLKPKEVSPIPFIPGGCMAIRADVFNRVSGFDDGFRGWGYEDQEISLNLWLSGYTCLAVPEVVLLHIFREIAPYPISVEYAHYNLLRMAITHFSDHRIQKVTDMIQRRIGSSDRILSMLTADDSYERREHFLSLHVHNDDWFMEKFGIDY